MDAKARTARLNQLMVAHGLTARAAGALIGRTAKTVRNWRSSTDRPIPIYALAALADALAKQEESQQ